MAALRSLAVVALALAVVQVSSATFCGTAPYGGLYGANSALGGIYAGAAYGDGYYPGAGADYSFPAGPAFGGVSPGVVEGCCPGQVIEKDTIVTKPVTIPYSYSVPTFSKKCFNNVNVDRKVIPSATVSQECNNQVTTIKVPTTDIVTKQQPLCKKTCTTSEYVIQIPIIETTCTSAPLCKKTVKAQNNVLTTVAAKTACAKQTCVSNNVIQRPIYQTVCQDYQGAINQVGAKTILKPEIKKTCVQLPPYKCLKPAAYGGAGYAGDLAYAGGAFGAGSEALYAGNYAGAYPAGGLAFNGAYPAGSEALYAGNYAGAYPAGGLAFNGAYPAGSEALYAGDYAGAYPVGGIYPGAGCGSYPVPSPCGC